MTRADVNIQFDYLSRRIQYNKERFCPARYTYNEYGNFNHNANQINISNRT